MPIQYSTVNFADLSARHSGGIHSMANGGEVQIDDATWRKWELAGFHDNTLRLVRNTDDSANGGGTWQPNPIDPVIDRESIDEFD